MVSSESDDSGRGAHKAFSLFMLFASLSGLSPSPAHALSLRKKKKPTNRAIDQYSDRLVTLGWPIAQNLGFSGAIGFATAFALKVVFPSLYSPFRPAIS